MSVNLNPPSTNTNVPNSIVVLAREHIGDLVCTTPALRSLRRLFPNAHIAVEIGERAVCVLENNPNIDEVIVRRDHQGLSGKLNFVRLLRRRKFDLAVMLATNADMALYMWLGGIPRRAGIVAKPRWSKLLTDSIQSDLNSHEMVDNFRNIVALLGGDISDARPELFPTAADVRTVDLLFGEERLTDFTTLVGINAGASAPANRWLAESFAELIRRISSRPATRAVVLGGPGDTELVRPIRDIVGDSASFLTGKLTVLQLAEAIKRCDLLVSNDSGPMHVSCAVRTPVIALFGPAVPHESGPCYVEGNIVIRNVTGCPGCTKYICRDDRRCMHAITVDEVTEKVFEQIDRIHALRSKPAETKNLVEDFGIATTGTAL